MNNHFLALITLLFIILPFTQLQAQCELDPKCVSKLDEDEFFTWLQERNTKTVELRDKESLEKALKHHSDVINIVEELGRDTANKYTYWSYVLDGYNHYQAKQPLNALLSYEKALDFLKKIICSENDLTQCMTSPCKIPLVKEIWYYVQKPMVRLYLDLGFSSAADAFIFSDEINLSNCWQDSDPIKADMLRMKGEIALLQYDTLKANEYFLTAYQVNSESIPAKIKIGNDYAGSLRSLARKNQAFENYDKSERILNESLRLIEEYPNSPNIQFYLADTYLYFGYLYRDRALYEQNISNGERLALSEKAASYFQKSLPLQNSAKDSSYVYWASGDLMRREGKYTEAIDQYRKQLCNLFPSKCDAIMSGKLPEPTENLPQLESLKALESLADCWKAIYEQEGDIKYLQEALNAHNLIGEHEAQLRSVYYLKDNRTLLTRSSSRRLDKAFDLCYLLWEKGMQEEALQHILNFQERARSIELKGAIKQAFYRDNLGVESKLFQEIAFKEKELERMVFEGIEENGELDSAVVDSMEHELDLFKRKLNRNRPDIGTEMFKLDSITVSDMRKYLGKGRMLAAYYYTEKFLYALYMDGGKQEFLKFDKNSIQDKISEVQEKIEATQNSTRLTRYEYMEISFSLYEDLFEKVDDWEAKEWIILADEDLYLFSLDALITEKAQHTDLRKFTYLWRERLLRYSFSLEFLLDPTSSLAEESLSYSYLGFGPSYDYPENGQYSKTSFSRSYGVQLQYNHEEIMKSGNLLRSYGKPMQLYINSLATKDNFLKQELNALLTHFSMHANIFQEKGENTAYLQFRPLVFNNPSDAPKERLFLNEIYQMDIKTKLVLLSSCLSASGKMENQEGIMSLGRAFSHAGAPNVMMSLWELNDLFSSIFVPIYLKYLKEGKGKAEALQKAKAEIMDSDDIEGLESKMFSPYYWSSFVLYGDDEAVFEKGSNLSIFWDLLFLALMIVILIRIGWKKTTKSMPAS